MPRLLSTLIALLHVGTALATTTPARSGCGDPVAVSQAYATFDADVLDVESSLVVSVARPASLPHGAPEKACQGERCLVQLVNLDPPTDQTTAAVTKKRLASLVRNHAATILVSPVQDRPEYINAVVLIEDESINEALLDAGLASYRSFALYALDGYLECMYLAEEQRARKASRGMWAPR